VDFAQNHQKIPTNFELRSATAALLNTADSNLCWMCLQLTMMLTEALNEDPVEGLEGVALGGALRAVMEQSYNRKRDMRRTAMTWARTQPAGDPRGTTEAGLNGVPDADGAADQPSHQRRKGASKRPRGSRGPRNGVSEPRNPGGSAEENEVDSASDANDVSTSNDDSDDGNDMPVLMGLPSRLQTASTSFQYREHLPDAPLQANVTAPIPDPVSPAAIGPRRPAAMGKKRPPSLSQGSDASAKHAAQEQSNGRKTSAPRKRASKSATAQKAGVKVSNKNNTEVGDGGKLRSKGRPPKPSKLDGDRPKKSASKGSRSKEVGGSQSARKKGSTAAPKKANVSKDVSERQSLVGNQVDLEQMKATLAEIDAALAEVDSSDG